MPSVRQLAHRPMQAFLYNMVLLHTHTHTHTHTHNTAHGTPHHTTPHRPAVALPGAQYAPLHGAIHRGCPEHASNSVVVGHALKRSLVAFAEAQRQQSLREIKRRALWRSQETRNLRRTPE